MKGMLSSSNTFTDKSLDFREKGGRIDTNTGGLKGAIWKGQKIRAKCARKVEGCHR